MSKIFDLARLYKETEVFTGSLQWKQLCQVAVRCDCYTCWVCSIGFIWLFCHTCFMSPRHTDSTFLVWQMYGYHIYHTCATPPSSIWPLQCWDCSWVRVSETGSRMGDFPPFLELLYKQATLGLLWYGCRLTVSSDDTSALSVKDTICIIHHIQSDFIWLYKMYIHLPNKRYLIYCLSISFPSKDDKYSLFPTSQLWGFAALLWALGNCDI